MTERSGVTNPPDLPEAIGDALFRLARALDRDMAAAAEPEGLTPLLARILRNIGDAESQRQLGHALGVGPAQISVAASALVNHKIVERKADPEDQRPHRPQM